jgi:Mg2+-importing ATPase
MEPKKEEQKKECVRLWAAEPKEVFSCLSTSERGLSSKDAKERIERCGPNDVFIKKQRHGLDIFLSQFTNPLVLVLVFAAMVAFFLHERIDGVVILAIVLMNAALGFYQEYKAERALRQLKQMVTVNAKVMRDGQLVEIPARDVVPGDVVYLHIGDIIPADIRLIHVEEMSADESPLTGESVPVIKDVTVVSESRSLPQYLKNVAFTGTHVSTGSGYGVVIGTGKNTFFGHTAAYLKDAPDEGEFQRSIRKFGNFTLEIILVMTIFIFAANALLGKNVFDSFLFAVALAVGITPEMLPIIMTITLSNGALRMSKDKVIVKRLASVEDLGNIDTLCCDKTGTLTEGAPSLSGYMDLDERKDRKVVLYGMLCTSAGGGKTKKMMENAVDKALWASSSAHLLAHELKLYKVLGENEFDFTRKRMSVLVRSSKGNMLIAKGAPESVISVCGSAVMGGQRVNLSGRTLSRIRGIIRSHESEGYTVIAVAKKGTSRRDTIHTDEKGLTLVGILLFIDPPKKTAKEALETLTRLGVAIKVISGDSPEVTRTVCWKVGLAPVEDKVVTGDDLDGLDEGSFDHYARKYNMFARVTPEQKYRIVSCLNHEGHIVGFLGDGINDAPAIKVADVGISVDTASGIAKEAADVILLKKSLSVLARGITEGRKTFGNITKYILNTISANYGNMFTVAISSLFMKFIPLLPSQILLNNFISDVPNLAVSTDRVDSELLRKPKRWNIKAISRFMMFFGFISTVFDLALILPLLFVLHASPEVFRTAWFVESACSEIIIVFAIRTHMPFLKSRPSGWLVLTSVVSLLAIYGITYTALGGRLFEFVTMPVEVFVLVGCVLVLYFVAAELAKRYFFRRFEMY